MTPSICVRMNNLARRLGGELQPRSLDLGHAAASDDTGDHNQRVVPSPRKSGTWVVARNLYLQWTCPSALPNCLLLAMLLACWGYLCLFWLLLLPPVEY